MALVFIVKFEPHPRIHAPISQKMNKDVRLKFCTLFIGTNDVNLWKYEADLTWSVQYEAFAVISWIDPIWFLMKNVLVDFLLWN